MRRSGLKLRCLLIWGWFCLQGFFFDQLLLVSSYFYQFHFLFHHYFHNLCGCLHYRYFYAWPCALHVILFVTAQLLIAQFQIIQDFLKLSFLPITVIAAIFFIASWPLSVKNRQPLKSPPDLSAILLPTKTFTIYSAHSQKKKTPLFLSYSHFYVTSNSHPYGVSTLFHLYTTDSKRTQNPQITSNETEREKPKLTYGELGYGRRRTIL